jgi:hypothetical protein
MLEAIKELESKDNTIDFVTSIRGDKMYVEVYYNQKLLIQENSGVLPDSFDDVLEEMILIKRLYKNVCKLVLNDIIFNESRV